MSCIFQLCLVLQGDCGTHSAGTPATLAACRRAQASASWSRTAEHRPGPEHPRAQTADTPDSSSSRMFSFQRR